MKALITNIPSRIYPGQDYPLEVYRISMDPKQRYAVLEIHPNKVFVAVKILSFQNDKEMLVGEYVDYCNCDVDGIMNLKFSLNWSGIDNSVCTLNLWAPELVNKFGGSFDKTVKAFNFSDD